MSCINCSSPLKKNATKYCSVRCQHEYQSKQRQSRLETGTNVGPKAIRTILFRERGRKCEQCSNTEWQEQPIPLEVEHCDGNHENNKLSNLKLLCPNCHALTPTYKARNRGNGRASRRKRYAEGKSY